VKTLSRLLLILVLLPLTASFPPAFARDRDDDNDHRRAAPEYSVHLIESCTIANVPAGSFMPDRAFIPGSTDPEHNQVFVQLPVNYGVITHGREVVLYDTGIQPSDNRPPFKNLVDLIGCVRWVPILDQLGALGIRARDVTKIVVGHGHWDHAGQLDQFPNAVLYIQGEELRGIEFALHLPAPLNRVNTDPPTTWPGGPLPAGCARTPACGYPPQTVAQINEKIVGGKAVIVEGTMQIAPGLKIHPAFRSHTAGSQLLQVNTGIGQLLFGSDTYSSWTGLKKLLAANIQQTDTVQQFLSYQKCITITGNGDTCVSAHEPLSYTSGYPLTNHPCPGISGFRCAVLAP
jgi:glyoxylase-like metal-dependent hydrolase (beta-lactamase superfamily II)